MWRLCVVLGRWFRFGSIIMAALACLGSVTMAAPAPLTIQARVAQNPLEMAMPSQVRFFSPDIGRAFEATGGASYAKGAVLFKTADGGRTWTASVISGPLQYSQARFLSPQVALVVGDTAQCGLVKPGCATVVRRTTNGGSSWQNVLTLRGQMVTLMVDLSMGRVWLESATANCFSVACRSVQHIWMGSNNGAQWTLMTKGVRVPAFAQVAPVRRGLLGLAGAWVYQSSDGGKTWTVRGHLPVRGVFDAGAGSLVQPQPGRVYASVCNTAAVGNGGCDNYLFQSVNGGRTWRQLWTQYCTDTTTVHFHSPTQGILLLAGQTACQDSSPRSNVVWSTRDGFLHLSRGDPLPLDVGAVNFLDAKTGYAVGPPIGCNTTDSASCPAEVAKTVDGGYSWHVIRGPLSPSNVVAGTGDGHWYAIGTPADPGAVLASTSGRRWRQVGRVQTKASGCGGPVLLQFTAVGRGFAANLAGPNLMAVGNDGETLRTVWTPPDGHLISSLSFVNARVGYALLGANGCVVGRVGARLYGTVDAGRHWRPTSPVPNGTTAVAFLTAQRGFALAQRCGKVIGGCQQRLWSTQDGGIKWMPTAMVARRLPASLTTASPGQMAFMHGSGVTVYRTGAPPMHIALDLVPGGWVPPNVRVWVSGGRIFLLLPGDGVWTGPVRSSTTLRPVVPF